VDLRAGQALVVAVVPLGEQFARLVDVQPGQFRRPLGTFAGRRHHPGIGQARTVLYALQRSRILLALGCQIDVGATGVPVGQRPLGLTVADQEHVVGGVVVRRVAHRSDANGEGGFTARLSESGRRPNQLVTRPVL